jgi:DNA-binding response OmpR family regulator
MVSTKQGELMLTAKELALLNKLNENRGNIVTFDALSDAVWGENYYGYENTLMVHIRRLREKIEKHPSAPVWLLTVRGLGYKLVKEAESPNEKFI